MMGYRPGGICDHAAFDVKPASMTVTAMHSTTLSPTYRPLHDGLRAAGLYLDAHRLRMRALCTTGEGIALAVAGADPRHPARVAFLPHHELADTVLQARTSRGSGSADLWSLDADPVLPTGYQDFLRALGGLAGEQGWRSVCLVGAGESLIVRYGYGDASARSGASLDVEGVHTLLNLSFARRRVAGEDIAPFPPNALALCATSSQPAPISYNGHGERVPEGGDDERYARALDALGYVLADRDGRDPLVVEIEDGYLLSCVLPSGEQEAVTVSTADVANLHREATHGRERNKTGGERLQLRVVGQCLDAQKAHGIVAQRLTPANWAIDSGGFVETYGSRDSVARTQRIITVPIFATPERPSRFKLFGR